MSQSNSLDQLLQCGSWSNICYWGKTSHQDKKWNCLLSVYKLSDVSILVGMSSEREIVTQPRWESAYISTLSPPSALLSDWSIVT